MEIKYQSDYVSKDRSFSVGTVNLLSGFALQINEPRPRLAEGKLAPGEHCMILFGITAEEHAMKDTDPQALAQLAADMRREVPQDRVLAVIVMDLTNKPVKKVLKLQTGASIDNGAFIGKFRVKAGPIDAVMVEARKLQDICSKKDIPAGVRENWDQARAKTGQALLNLDHIYVPYDKLLKSRYPYVREGRVELFTTPERAEKAMARAKALNFGEDAWDLKEIASNDFSAFLDSCTEAGLNALRIDTATLEVLLFIKDICERETPANAALRGCVIQEVACGTRFEQLKSAELIEPERRKLLERVLTLRNFSQRALGNAVLWSVGTVQGAPASQLCTPNAGQKLDAPAMNTVSGANYVMINLKGNDSRFLALFTSEIKALAFAEKINGEPRPIAMTFDDARAIVLNTGNASGLILDVDDLGYRTVKEQFDNVLELRNNPPRIVRIKEPEQTQDSPAAAVEQKPVNEVALPDPDLSVLPDPDLAENSEIPSALAPIEETDRKTEPTSESAETTKKEKGGFFRKLFGKK